MILYRSDLRFFSQQPATRKHPSLSRIHIFICAIVQHCSVRLKQPYHSIFCRAPTPAKPDLTEPNFHLGRPLPPSTYPTDNIANSSIVPQTAPPCASTCGESPRFMYLQLNSTHLLNPAFPSQLQPTPGIPPLPHRATLKLTSLTSRRGGN